MRINNSGIYSGHVRHRRFTPILHRFRYSMFMVYLDVDEIDALCDKVTGFGRAWFHFARFRRQDYIGGTDDINQAVEDKIYALTGERIHGRVSMLCHLRYGGLYFSPLNLYYIFDQQGDWQYVLAEVSNTLGINVIIMRFRQGSIGSMSVLLMIKGFMSRRLIQ